MRRVPVTISLALALALAACGDDGDHVVPFGHDTTDPVDDPGTREPPPDTDDAASWRPRDGVTLEPAETVPLGESQTLTPAPWTLHVQLELDVDEDDTPDFLFVGTRTDPSPAYALLFSRGAVSPPTLEELSRGALQEGCALESSTLHQLDPHAGVAKIVVTCEPNETRAASEVERQWALGLRGTPRILERFDAVHPTQLELSVRDLDEDGRADFRLETELPGGTLGIDFLDRTSALEADLAPFADRAATLRDQAREAVALGRTEGEAALSRLSGLMQSLEGVRVAGQAVALPEDLVGSLATLRAAARLGDSEQGIGSWLRDGVAPEDLAAAHPEVRRLFEERLVALARPVGTVSIAQVPSPPPSSLRRNATLVWRDPQTIAVRGVPALALSTEGGPSAPDVGPAPAVDPESTLAAIGFVSDGCTTSARVVAASAPALEGAPTRALVPISGPSESCTPGPLRGDDTFRVLGWAPQGLVVARGARRLLAPLRPDGSALAPPRELRRDQNAPAPLRGARTTIGGEVWIDETPHGVVRYSATGAELWRDAEWAPVDAAALSPDGAGIAILRGDEVRVMRMAGTDAPPQNEVRPIATGAPPGDTPAADDAVTNEVAPSPDSTTMEETP